MSDLTALRFRPDLKPPRTERTAREATAAGVSTEAAGYPGVPPGALPYLMGARADPPGPRLADLTARAGRLRAALAAAAPAAGGLTPQDYLAAAGSAAARYEAAVLQDGTSLSAMLLPAAQELADTAAAAEQLAAALAPYLPSDLSAHLAALQDALAARRYDMAAAQMLPLALLDGLHHLADSLAAVADELTAAGESAPIDALGDQPAAALSQLLEDAALLQSVQTLLTGQEQASLSHCTAALERRRRVEPAAVLTKLTAALPSLITQRLAMAELSGAYDPQTGAAGAVVALALAEAKPVLEQLQSAIGDVSRIGDLLLLEWREYTKTVKRRYLAKQGSMLLERARAAAPADVSAWLTEQAELTARPSLG